MAVYNLQLNGTFYTNSSYSNNSRAGVGIAEFSLITGNGIGLEKAEAGVGAGTFPVITGASGTFATIGITRPLRGMSATCRVGKSATISIKRPERAISATVNISRVSTISLTRPARSMAATATIGRAATISIVRPLRGMSANITSGRIATISITRPLRGMLAYGYVTGSSSLTVQAVIVNARNGAHSEYIAGTSAYYKTGDIDTWKGSESMPAAKKGNLEMWMSHTGDLKCKVEGAADGIYSYPVQSDGRIVMGKGLTDRWKSFKFMNCIGDTGSTTLSSAVTGNKFTRATGSFVTDGFATADLFTASGFGSGVDGDYTVYSVSATEIVVVEVIPATVTGGGDERLLSNSVFTVENARLKADATRRAR